MKPRLTLHPAALAGLLLIALAAVVLPAPAPNLAQPQPAGAPGAPVPLPVSEEEAFQLGLEAYIYGYPLVTMEMTRRIMTNVAAPKESRAPMGQFVNARAYPGPAFREVTTPNADTLYSTAWLDLSREPYVLSLPDMRDRYFLMPLLSAWTEVFADPGTRTTGTAAQTYAITGPNWTAPLPPGLKELKAPTNLVWLLGRTYCTGTLEDYRAVHALQDQYKLVPLSAYGKPYKAPPGQVNPNLDLKTPVREQVNRLEAEAYFKLLAALLPDNPPAPEDAPLIAGLARIGLIPGQDFHLAKLDPAAARGLTRVPKAGLARIMAHEKSAGELANGWLILLKAGNYATDYLQRAFLAAIGLGANRPQDAVYPMAKVDSRGRPLSGAQRYVLNFPKDQLPPVKGFWSLTMYDAGYFFVANPLNRYTLSSRNKFIFNRDGSLTLYIQPKTPGLIREPNWLPAPPGDFILILRLYWPLEPPAASILNGTWKPPAVERVL
jgi:hypothetical protein